MNINGLIVSGDRNYAVFDEYLYRRKTIRSTYIYEHGSIYIELDNSTTMFYETLIDTVYVFKVNP